MPETCAKTLQTRPAPLSALLADPTLLALAQAAEQSGIALTNPANGQFLGNIPTAGTRNVEVAIGVAQQAFVAWRGESPYRRGEVLQLWADELAHHRQDLARIITAEQGKPLHEARDEVDYGLSFLRWFAEEGKRTYGETIPSHKPNSRLFTVLQPVGVTAAITPWNWPLAMITRKAGAALAAGCPMIVKPANETGLTAYALLELANRAGMPEGVFQIVTGDAAEIGDVLMDHPAIRSVSFTGSTRTGKLLLARSAGTVKRMALELGGHAPFIVCADADLEAALDGAMAAKYEAAGQSCTALNKCLVHASHYDRFCSELAARSSRLKVGDGADPATEVGALTRFEAIAHCSSQVEDALAKGARLLTGGSALPGPGNFFAPTVIADVTPAMRIFTEETFGPILPLTRFERIEQAIELANCTEYGLAAFAYANDYRAIWQLVQGLEAGMVGINTVSMTGPPVPFGGVKQSGLGREGSWRGIEDFVEVKYACLGGIPDIY